MVARSVRGGIMTILTMGIGWLVLASGLDRMSAANSTLSRYVPSTLRGFAYSELVQGAIERSDLRTAQVLAEDYVRAAPVEANATALLGVARLEAGDAAGAASAFSVAGTFGWRNQPAQLYWLSTALSAGSWDIAAQRLDALLRVSTDIKAFEPLIVQMERSPEGIKAWRQRVLTKPSPPWIAEYIQSVPALDGAARERRLTTLGMYGARDPVSCTSAVPAVNALFTQGEVVASRRMWSMLCGRATGARAGLYNGSFEKVQQANASVPFEWTLMVGGAIDVGITTAPGPLSGKALFAQSDADVTTAVAEQWLSLPPGRYRLKSRTMTDNGQAGSRTRFTIRCVAPSKRNAARGEASIMEASGPTVFTVPGGECSSQLIEIALSPKNGTVRGMEWVDDIAILPIT